MASNFTKINEKFDHLSEKIEQFEANFSKGNKIEVQEIRTNNPLLITNSNTEIFKKIEKFENSLNRIEQLLLRLINKSDDNNNNKNMINGTDVMIEMTSQQSSNTCDPNPCLYGGKCQLAASGRDYYCVDCPNLRSGKRCENLNCPKESRCWTHGNTLYVVYETLLNWSRAAEKCAGEGMTLAMPKDEDSAEFLATQLTPIYNCSPCNHLWVGLKRDNRENVWRWVDGSPFETDNHKGNMHIDSTIAGSSYGLLAVFGGDLGWWWFWAYDTAHFYPVCEHRHFINN